MGKDTAQKQQFWSPEEEKARQDSRPADNDGLDDLEEIGDINPSQAEVGVNMDDGESGTRNVGGKKKKKKKKKRNDEENAIMQDLN